MLSAGETLAERFDYFDDRLSSFQDDLNIKISSSVLDINQFAESIAALNSTISLQQAGTGVAAGDLLDQRDQAITELSRLVKTTVQAQDDGALNIFIGQGQPLVIGTDISTVSTVPNSERANRLDIQLTTTSGSATNITNFVSEGEIGASLTAYEDVIEQARRDIGVLAAGITVTFNEVHRQGFDLNDATDLAFFDESAADPGFVALATNTGVINVDGVNISATIYDPDPLLSGDITQVTGDSYRLSYNGGVISVLNLTTNVITDYAAPGAGTDFEEQIDGVRIFIDSATVDNLNNGDRFLLEPTGTSAERFGVALTEASQLAAASATGSPGDATNVLSLIDLGDQQTLLDGATYFDVYTNTSSRIAVQTRRAQSLAETEAALLQSAEARRSNVSGVSLEEEAANLIRYQQAYQAAAQVIATSRDVFDILVGATQ